MFDLEGLAATPWQPRPVIPGSHNAIAERYRDRAIHMSTMLIIFAELLNLYLREHPDDDARFDQAAERIYPLIVELGLEVQAFRETRDIESEN